MTQLSIQSPQYRPKSHHGAQNPHVCSFDLCFPSSTSNVILPLDHDENNLAAGSNTKIRKQNHSMHLRYTISPLPHHPSSMQYIIQAAPVDASKAGSSTSTSSTLNSLKNTNYWLIICNYFREWRIKDVSIFGGIQSLDLKISLKYVMGRQVMYGLIVRNDNSGDVWIGASSFIGHTERQSMQIMKKFGLRVDTDKDSSRDEPRVAGKEGQNVWISFVKRGLRADQFKYLPSKQNKHPKEPLDFSRGALQFGIMLLSTSRSQNIESVTAMQKLKLVLRVRDPLFFQNVERNTHDIEMESCETTDFDGSCTSPMSGIGGSIPPNVHQCSPRSTSICTDSPGGSVLDRSASDFMKEYVRVDLVSTKKVEESNSGTSFVEQPKHRSWEVDWQYLSVSRLERQDKETNGENMMDSG